MTNHELETIISMIQESCCTMRIRGEDMMCQLNTLTETLCRCLPEFFVYRDGCVEFCQEFLSTRQGSYGAALSYYADEYGTRRVVPEQWKDAGRSYYFLHDVNNEIRNATRSQIAKVAKALPDFLEALLEDLQGANSEMQDSIDVLTRMLNEGEQANET